jgi:hypothetical protein
VNQQLSVCKLFVRCAHVVAVYKHKKVYSSIACVGESLAPLAALSIVCGLPASTSTAEAAQKNEAKRSTCNTVLPNVYFVV